MDQRETKYQVCQNRQFQHITYKVKNILMLISFFLQTITQANKNQYQANKSLIKVSNKITRRRCRGRRSKVFLKIAVLKDWQNL